MDIRITTAQQELHTRYTLNGATTNTTTLSIHDLDTYRNDLEALRDTLQLEPYTPTQGRYRFAALYLLKKINGHTTHTTTPVPTSDTMEIGQTVYLLHQNEGQTFRVQKINSDGSICLYGGTTQYQGFRDIRPADLTHKRPRSMSKIRTADMID